MAGEHDGTGFSTTTTSTTGTTGQDFFHRMCSEALTSVLSKEVIHSMMKSLPPRGLHRLFCNLDHSFPPPTSGANNTEKQLLQPENLGARTNSHRAPRQDCLIIRTHHPQPSAASFIGLVPTDTSAQLPPETKSGDWHSYIKQRCLKDKERRKQAEIKQNQKARLDASVS